MQARLAYKPLEWTHATPVSLELSTEIVRLIPLKEVGGKKTEGHPSEWPFRFSFLMIHGSPQ